MLDTDKDPPTKITGQIANKDVENFNVDPVNAAALRQPLYAARQKIFPKRAQGNFRKFKWLVMAVTLGIYYLTPWLRWDRGAYAPDQAVLVDLANQRFYFLFIEIWPQEFYYVAGLLVMAGIGLFLVTSTVGRAWCGYTCPQTVWVDLFLVVERAIEGDRNARMKLDAAPWSFNKVWRRVLKHTIWIIIGLATGGAWIFYFADAPTLLGDLLRFEAAPVAYATMLILTATTYTFGGLMREQVCTYMCPWPRIQAAMLDEYSLTVTYNSWRGEPRSKHAKKALKQGKQVGDCVDCNACVAVCPMGIDIRDGQQLECITCALCIDACDNVMDKLGKERGLISYATLNDFNENVALAGMANSANDADPEMTSLRAVGGNAPVLQSATKPFRRQFNTDSKALGQGQANNVLAAGKAANSNQAAPIKPEFRRTNWRSIVRPRTLIYFGVWIAVGLAMLFVLSTRDRLDLNVLHDRNPLYVLLSDGSLRNGYDVKILNMEPEPRQVEISLEGLTDAKMSIGGQGQIKQDKLILELEPDKVLPIRLFVTVHPDKLDALPTRFSLIAQDIAGEETAIASLKFEGP